METTLGRLRRQLGEAGRRALGAVGFGVTHERGASRKAWIVTVRPSSAAGVLILPSLLFLVSLLARARK
jgi:hypothetical protein